MEELKRLSQEAKEAEDELLRCLRVDAEISENMEDYWRHLASGAD